MKLSQHLNNAGSLLDATSAITNWRALLLMAATLLCASVPMALLSMTHSSVGMLLGMLLFAIILFYGANAVGILLMDAAANGGKSRPISDAVMASLFSSHRILVLALMAIGVVLALLLVIAVLLLLCKIPVLGPVLLTVVLPLSALAFGCTMFTISYVFYPMAAAAVWSGATIGQTVTNLLAITRQKLIPVVIQEVLVLLMGGLVAMFIGGVVFSGLATVSGMAASIVGVNSIGLLGLFVGGGHGSGTLIAMMIGGGLLFAIAMVIPALIVLQGYCQIYLGSLDGLDLVGASQLLDQSSKKLKQKQDEIFAKMEEQRQRNQAASAAQPHVAPATSVEPISTPVALSACPACGTLPPDPEGRFCGECGKALG